MFEEDVAMGWYPGLEERYRQALPNVTVPNTTCHLPRPDAFHMCRDPVRGDLPWPGLIFGLTVLATWCWWGSCFGLAFSPVSRVRVLEVCVWGCVCVWMGVPDLHWLLAASQVIAANVFSVLTSWAGVRSTF